MPLHPEAREKVWLPVRNEKCTQCPLHEEAQSVCLLGDGPVPSDIMVVGEAPGKREDDIARPFSGVAGQYLDKVLQEIGLPRESLYITNAVRCRPPENRTPTRGEIKACGNYMQSEIEIVRPKYLLLLGNAALQAILNTSGIMKKRGVMVEKNGYQVFPTIHPAAVLRNPGWENSFKSDLLAFARHVKGEFNRPETVSKLVTSSKGLSRFCELLSSVDTPIAFDVETGSSAVDPAEDAGLHPWLPDGVIHTVAFSWEPGKAIVVAPEHPAVKWDIPIERVYEALNVALKDKKMIGHNLKFDLAWMRRKGVHLYGFFDTKLARHLLDENGPQGLKPLSRAFLGAGEYEAGVYFGGSVTQLNRLAIYNGKDADYTLRLYHLFRDELKKQSRLTRIFVKLVMPACRAFTEIETHGFPVDMERLESRHQECLKKIEEITAELMSYIPEDWKPLANFRSPLFLGRWLFDYLKLPIIQVSAKTRRPSTAEAVLIRLKERHPAVGLLMELRKWQKYESTYTRNWLDRIRRAGKPRLYTSYNISGTVTGRLSSDMQQVPRDIFIRSIIGAKTGWKFIEADFSQIELRIAAMLSRDKALIEAFNHGGDPHAETASAILGKPPAEVTKEERKMAKAVNFGFLYGMGAKKFKSYAKEKYGIEVNDAEAADYRRRFFSQYAALPAWHDRQRRVVRNVQAVTSPIGRVRHLPTILSTDEMVQGEAEREAINSPVQGLASDLTVLSMVLLQEAFRERPDVRIIGNVHDSILLEAKEDVAEEIAQEVKYVMEHLPLKKYFGFTPTVPVEAEVVVGQHWGEK